MSTRIPSAARLWRTHASVRQRFRVDVLAEAKAICHDDLADAPDDVARLHLRGLLALREHQEDFAIACLSRAWALAPADAECAAPSRSSSIGISTAAATTATAHDAASHSHA